MTHENGGKQEQASRFGGAYEAPAYMQACSKRSAQAFGQSPSTVANSYFWKLVGNTLSKSTAHLLSSIERVEIAIFQPLTGLETSSRWQESYKKRPALL